MGRMPERKAPGVYGRYETLFRIASGGMAEVYAARSRGEAGFQKLVALKRMLPHLTDDERFVTMFMDEGRLAANITSPHVVSTMDLGRADDGSLYLVMELVVGTTLSTLLRNAARAGGGIPIDIGVELLAQAAQGLHDAHEARTPFGAPLHIVHRDISPQNILVGTDGRARITDFGVARAIMRRTKTSTGEFKGKLSYFSPEQCADRNLDRRSDIFSLGVVAWETLTTRRLFHAENPLAVLERVTRMPIPAANVVNPQVPPAVAAVVATALERNRDARFSTALEFATALRGAARGVLGSVDTARLGAFVDANGGDALDKMQEKLKSSLAGDTRLDISIGDEDGTEISSGIVIREDPSDLDDLPTIGSAPGDELFAMPADSAALTTGGHRAQATPHKSSPLPYVIAAIVALLGLTGGVWIALAAMSPSPGIQARTLPPAEPAVETPTAALPPPPVIAPPVEPPIGGGVETPAPDHVEEPAPARTPGRRRPPHRGSSATQAEVQPAPTRPATPPRRPGGLLDLNSFDNEIGGR